MKFQVFLQSKVARRVFALFVLCALLPITALAGLGYRSVTGQLREQGERRLHEENRAIASGVFERLEVLEDRLVVVARELRRAGEVSVAEELLSSVERQFRAIAVVTGTEPPLALLGRPLEMPELSEGQRDHLRRGGSLFLAAGSRAYLVRAIQYGDDRRLVAGEVQPIYVWTGREGALPFQSSLCVLGTEHAVLYCSAAGNAWEETLSSAIRADRASSQDDRTDAGQLVLRLAGASYLVDYRDVPVAASYHLPQLTTVLLRRETLLLEPLANFNVYFLGVVLGSLWIVVLLSSVQIRRSLDPLHKLQAGTRRIARREFDARVDVASGDEFEELADSFNTMARRLGRQFHALSATAEIDRAILSSLDIQRIVDTLLVRMSDVLSCAAVSVTLFAVDDASCATTYFAGSGNGAPGQRQVRLEADGISALADDPGAARMVDAADRLPAHLQPIAPIGVERLLVLPLSVEGELAGVICLGWSEPVDHDEDDISRARQVADQVAVALSNARLVEELDELSWGTLMALARAVDEKSAWTAGHSERVTALSVELGNILGLDEETLDTLHRGALIHDIGKIGIPAEILDKPAPLTGAEFALMKEHPRKGARILEPIPGYAPIIPIVLQHHERYDGLGYPDGAAGETIDLLARILAVADVYDALTSDRPYRRGMERGRVIDIVREGAGSQFDPRVVEAFIALMRKKDPAEVSDHGPSRRQRARGECRWLEAVGSSDKGARGSLRRVLARIAGKNNKEKRVILENVEMLRSAMSRAAPL